LESSGFWRIFEKERISWTDYGRDEACFRPDVIALAVRKLWEKGGREGPMTGNNRSELVSMAELAKTNKIRV